MPTFAEHAQRARPRVLLLTGDRSAGKSTLCGRLAHEARNRGLAVGGLDCPATFNPAGAKNGCRARNLATGEEWELGSTERDLGGPRWKGWSFSEEGFSRANLAVREALETGASLVVLDEIGPMELTLGDGLKPSLRSLEASLAAVPETAADLGAARARGTLAILVVRQELAGELADRFPGAILIRVEPSAREAAFELALGELFRDPAPGG